MRRKLDSRTAAVVRRVRDASPRMGCGHYPGAMAQGSAAEGVGEARSGAPRIVAGLNEAQLPQALSDGERRRRGGGGAHAGGGDAAVRLPLPLELPFERLRLFQGAFEAQGGLLGQSARGAKVDRRRLGRARSAAQNQPPPQQEAHLCERRQIARGERPSLDQDGGGLGEGACGARLSQARERRVLHQRKSRGAVHADAIARHPRRCEPVVARRHGREARRVQAQAILRDEHPHPARARFRGDARGGGGVCGGGLGRRLRGQIGDGRGGFLPRHVPARRFVGGCHRRRGVCQVSRECADGGGERAAMAAHDVALARQDPPHQP
mmetsp:Transcript_2291/g.8359  ORF Transcript_2291/g.8359 Transcript_2291/m.8359 type:complete len:323 (+) Transcript_2291:118-1086(+)